MDKVRVGLLDATVPFVGQGMNLPDVVVTAPLLRRLPGLECPVLIMIEEGQKVARNVARRIARITKARRIVCVHASVATIYKLSSPAPEEQYQLNT